MQKTEGNAVKPRTAPSIALLSFLAALFLLLSACAADREPAEPAGIVPSGKPAEQIGPLEAWDVLSTCFRVREGGGTEYPPDYAGAWIDGDELHVALVPEAENGPDYDSLLAGFGCVVFEEAKYPLNDLLALGNRVFRRLGETCRVYVIGPDERENLLRLGADRSEDKDEIYEKIDGILDEESLRTGVFEGIRAEDLFVVEDAEPIRAE